MKVLLDACVLVPASTREVLLAAAAEGLFQPLWSPSILAEWQHAAARRGGAAARIAAQRDQMMVQAAFPTALVDGAAVRAAEGLGNLPRLPDPQDGHVLAAAVAAGAQVLLTFNTRDFPRRPLAALAIAPRDPDGLLWEIWSGTPDPVARAVLRARGRLSADTDQSDTPHPALPRDKQGLRAFLRRAGMPRLGRAMAPSPPPGTADAGPGSA